MGLLELWLPNGTGKLLRRGRPDRLLDTVADGFVLGYTPVTSNNVGVQAQWKGNLTPHNGDFTLTSNGQVVEGLDISGRVIFGDFTGTVRNCIIRVGAATTYGTQRTGIHCFGNPGAGFNRIIEFCEIRPSAPSVDIYGIAGWGYELRRSLIVDVVDACNIQRSPDQLSHSARIYSNYLETVWYAEDPRQSDGSHDDIVQSFYGSLIEIIGNTCINPVRKGQCLQFDPRTDYGLAPCQLKNVIIKRNRLVNAYTQISFWSQVATVPGLVIEDNVHVGARGSSGTHQWDLLITSANNTAAASISGNVTDATPAVASHINVNG